MLSPPVFFDVASFASTNWSTQRDLNISRDSQSCTRRDALQWVRAVARLRKSAVYNGGTELLLRPPRIPIWAWPRLLVLPINQGRGLASSCKVSRSLCSAIHQCERPRTLRIADQVLFVCTFSSGQLCLPSRRRRGNR